MVPAHKSPSDKSINVYIVILVPPFILNHTFHATVILPFHVAIGLVVPFEQLACPHVFANLPPFPLLCWALCNNIWPATSIYADMPFVCFWIGATREPHPSFTLTPRLVL